MAGQVRSDRLQRAFDPRPRIHRMQAVEQQQMRGQLVFAEARRKLWHQLHDARQSSAVDVQQTLDGVDGHLASISVRQRLQLRQSSLELGDTLPRE